MRKLIIAIVILLGVVFVVGRFSEVESIINTIAPSAGIGGMTVFIAESRQNGNTGARAMGEG